MTAKVRSQSRRRIAVLFITAILVVALIEVGRDASNGEPDAAKAADAPNLIMIYVDDEPARFQKALRFTRSMPAANFRSAIISNPRCCPSRASLLSGQYSQHNDVSNNYEAENLDDSKTLATYLDPTYDTALVGKYLNEWETIDGPSYVPPGWDHWFAHYGSFNHYDYTVSDNGSTVSYGHDPADYGTDVFGKQALDFISNADDPFFLYFTPLAPHVPFTPGPGHENDFPDWKPKLPPNFNRTDRGAPGFYRHRHKTTEKLERKRIVLINRMLASIDDYVRNMVELLKEKGEYKNTYIVFMSDNGLSLGSHRWWRKGCPYEECVRVPMRISGPGIKPRSVATPVSNIDITPTLLDLAGIDAPAGADFDGVSVAPLLGKKGKIAPRSILIHSDKEKHQGPAFDGLRTSRWKYIESKDGSLELYDLRKDRYELHNLAHDGRHGKLIRKFAKRLDRLRR